FLKGLGSNGLVPDVVVGRNSVATEQCDAELDQPGAVGLDFVGNRADDGALARAHLFEGLGDAVLGDNREILLSAGVAGGIEGAGGGGGSGGSDKDVLAFSMTGKEFGCGRLAGLAHSAAL